MFKISIEQTKRNERSYSYSYLFENLVQKSFQGSFYVCIKFLKKIENISN
jgi:hypothetical protein